MLATVPHVHGHHGSIPAHAGKPGFTALAPQLGAVYPRPRGEAGFVLSLERRVGGLSPPTRGSPSLASFVVFGIGSIPAHAGKPTEAPEPGQCLAVYPRPRGEAAALATLAHVPRGLSPPTRGSRQSARVATLHKGSIPAHAGKPNAVRRHWRAWTVYPRPRGEAPRPRPLPTRTRGLSPPTRGSRNLTRYGCQNYGSIPAHAGKPPDDRAQGSRTAVYPRPRGEAFERWCEMRSPSGLSPPTRGSPVTPAYEAARLGSIPAHAGKPFRRTTTPWDGRVYPRPRGEAHPFRHAGPLRGGLSPPTRGSHPGGQHHQVLPRSIPAHAGKPTTSKLRPK